MGMMIQAQKKQYFLLICRAFGAAVQMPVICGKLPNVALCGSVFMLAPSPYNLGRWAIAWVNRDGCNTESWPWGVVSAALPLLSMNTGPPPKAVNGINSIGRLRKKDIKLLLGNPLRVLWWNIKNLCLKIQNNTYKNR